MHKEYRCKKGRIKVVVKKVKKMPAVAEKVYDRKALLDQAQKLSKSLTNRSMEAGISAQELIEATNQIVLSVRRSRRKRSY